MNSTYRHHIWHINQGGSLPKKKKKGKKEDRESIRGKKGNVTPSSKKSISVLNTHTHTIYIYI